VYIPYCSTWVPSRKEVYYGRQGSGTILKKLIDDRLLFLIGNSFIEEHLETDIIIETGIRK
jgi:hypothetical protein